MTRDRIVFRSPSLIIICPFHRSVSFQKIQCLEFLLDVFSKLESILNFLGIRHATFGLEHFVTSVSEVLVPLGVISAHPEQFLVQLCHLWFEGVLGDGHCGRCGCVDESAMSQGRAETWKFAYSGLF